MKQSIYKYSLVFLLFMSMYNNSTAQISRYIKVIQKNFNWGVRAGFDATYSNSYQMYQNDTEIRGNATNQVGLQGGVFGRTNIGIFFIQPDFSFYWTREKLHLNIPVGFDLEMEREIIQQNTVEKSIQSLNAAMLLGYNIVKSDAYVFNFFLGPNLKRNYIDKYKINGYEHRSSQNKLNFVAGVSANVSYFYFDFRFEGNIPSKRDINFSEIENLPDNLKDISIRKTENILSFSLGMMF